jgi:hypothetical protein
VQRRLLLPTVTGASCGTFGRSTDPGAPRPGVPRRVAARRFGRTAGDRRRCPSKYQWRRRGGAARRRAKARRRVRSRASRVRRRGRAARRCGFRGWCSRRSLSAVIGQHNDRSVPRPALPMGRNKPLCASVAHRQPQWCDQHPSRSARASGVPGLVSAPVAIGPRAERRRMRAAKEAKDAKKALPGHLPSDRPEARS